MAAIAFIIAWLIMQWTEPIIKYVTLLIIFVLVYDFVVKGDTSTAAFVVGVISKAIGQAVVILQQVAEAYSKAHPQQVEAIVSQVQQVVNNTTNNTTTVPIIFFFLRKNLER